MGSILPGPHEQPAGDEHQRQTHRIVRDKDGGAFVKPRRLSDRRAEQGQNVQSRQTQNEVSPCRQRVGGATALCG